MLLCICFPRPHPRPANSNLCQFIFLSLNCVFFFFFYRIRIIVLLDCFFRQSGSRLVCCCGRLENVNEPAVATAEPSISPGFARSGPGMQVCSGFLGFLATGKSLKMLNPETHGSEKAL